MASLTSPSARATAPDFSDAVASCRTTSAVESFAFAPSAQRMSSAARPCVAAHVFPAMTVTASSNRTTCCTPGIAFAFESSTLASLPPNTGDTATEANLIPGSCTSMPNLAVPLTFSGESSRFAGVPMSLKSFGSLSVTFRPTIRELARRDVPFVTSLGVGAHLEAWGVRQERIAELDWWESYTLPNAELSVTAGPSQHFSGRGLHDRNATLWSSMIIRSPRHAVFFSGDTGLTTEYATIRERLGRFDLVMLEVGGLHPSWGDLHLGPENALEALALLGGGAFLPVHWGTFALAMHDWDQPAEALLTLGPKKGARLLMPRLGKPVDPARAYEVTPWWRVVDSGEVRQQASVAPVLTLPKAMPWPLD